VAIGTLRLASPAPAVAAKHEVSPLANTRLGFLIAFFLFLYVGAEVSFAGWIFTYATELKLSAASTAAYLTSLFWGSLTLGRVLTIPIAVRFRPRSILIVSLGGCLLSLGLILVSPGSFAAVLIGTICLGLSMASIFPTTLSFAGRRVKVTGQLTGWFIVASSAGAMLIPLVIGQAFRSVGPRVVMIVTTTTLLAAVGVLVCVIRNSEPTWSNASVGGT
ncbi:MAG TPA: MFS transporter, partial [Pyrinomonadaceae bacterium]|nr:MFS transporter [Pyrinomonadaceae bacterium]